MKLRGNQITLLNTIKAEMEKLILNSRFLDARIFIDSLYVSIAYMDSVNTVTKADEDEMWGDIKPSQEFNKTESEKFTPLLPLLGDKPSVVNLDTMREFANKVNLILESA